MKQRLHLKIISILLAAVICFSCFPFSSRAEETETIKRYTVLVLDTSSSSNFTSGGELIYTANTAIDYVKRAASKFFVDVVNADGTNYVAVVSFQSTATLVSDFTTDINKLDTAVARLTASDSVRDISAGLERADLLLESVPNGSNVRKNVVLFTTGMTNAGDYNYSGYFDEDSMGSNWYRTDTGIHLYAYANHAIEAAEHLKQQATLYTLGLFQTMDEMPEKGKDVVELFKATAAVLATSENYYFPVDNPDDLEFTFGDVAENITETVITSKFKWAGGLKDDKEDQESTCYFSDRYFMENSTTNNSHLRTMSLAFELSSWSSNESDNWTKDPHAQSAKWQNARDLLFGIEGNDDYPGLGFNEGSLMLNSFWDAEPMKDSIGLLAANKTLYDGSTLVALAIRGGGYGQEWASNFTVGRSGDHDGFAKARDTTLEFLDDYFNKYEITGPIKLWIVGYSRAGVVANMVGGALDSGSYTFENNVTVAFNDLFVYAFEPPQGTLMENVGSGDYSNIHNIVNKNDLVPMVAPSAWGFGRYSNDFYIPGSGTKVKAMLDVLDGFDGMTNAREYYKIQETVQQYSVKVNWKKILPGGDPFIELDTYDVSANYAISNSVDFLADGVFGSRTLYYADWQAGVREIMALLNGGSLTDLASDGISMEEFIDKFFKELTFSRICEIVSPAFSLNILYTKDERKADIKKNIDVFVADVLSDSDLWGTVRWTVGLKDSLVDLLNRFFQSAVEDLLLNNATSLQSAANTIILLVKGGLIQAHFSEITLAWMMSMDSYYGGTDQTTSNQATRIVHINCPVDITVYDGNDNVVASIIGDEIYNKDSYEIQAFINVNNEKIVMLPPDDSFRVSIVATGDGQVNVSIDEYYYSSMSVNRLQNYYDIPVQRGEQLTALLPELSEKEATTVCQNGSSVNYVLYDEYDSPIAPDEALAGAEAQTTYNVTVEVEGDYGTVSGDGTYVRGNFAQMVAFPQNGATFEGWYENGVLISDSETYRFAVTEDRNLSAKFCAPVVYTLTVNADNGGSVVNAAIEVAAGTQVNVIAVADPGYVFDGWTAESGSFNNSNAEDTWFTMPENDVCVTAHFKELENHDASCPSKNYLDVPAPSDWAHEGIDYVVAHGMFNGVGNNRFDPEGSMTRAMLVTVLWRYEGSPTGYQNTFSDVNAKDGSWYIDAVAWAAAKGVVNGVGNGKFDPEDKITREQMTAVLFRYADKKGLDTSKRGDLNGFPDNGKVESWAKDAMQWAVAEGIINGSDGKLLPQGDATRAQVATILMRFIENIVKK